jgi:cell division protease FtsH
LTILAEKLLESEVIFKEDLEEIFGKRAWEPQEMTGEEFVAGLAESAEEKETRAEEEAKSVSESVEEKATESSDATNQTGLNQDEHAEEKQ